MAEHLPPDTVRNVSRPTGTGPGADRNDSASDGSNSNNNTESARGWDDAKISANPGDGEAMLLMFGGDSVVTADAADEMGSDELGARMLSPLGSFSWNSDDLRLEDKPVPNDILDELIGEVATASSAQSSTAIATATAGDTLADGNNGGGPATTSVPWEVAVRQALAYAITLTDTVKHDLSLAHHLRPRRDITPQCLADVESAWEKVVVTQSSVLAVSRSDNGALRDGLRSALARLEVVTAERDQLLERAGRIVAPETEPALKGGTAHSAAETCCATVMGVDLSAPSSAPVAISAAGATDVAADVSSPRSSLPTTMLEWPKSLCCERAEDDSPPANSHAALEKHAAVYMADRKRVAAAAPAIPAENALRNAASVRRLRNYRALLTSSPSSAAGIGAGAGAGASSGDGDGDGDGADAGAAGTGGGCAGVAVSPDANGGSSPAAPMRPDLARRLPDGARVSATSTATGAPQPKDTSGKAGTSTTTPRSAAAAAACGAAFAAPALPATPSPSGGERLEWKSPPLATHLTTGTGTGSDADAGANTAAIITRSQVASTRTTPRRFMRSSGRSSPFPAAAAADSANSPTAAPPTSTVAAAFEIATPPNSETADTNNRPFTRSSTARRIGRYGASVGGAASSIDSTVTASGLPSPAETGRTVTANRNNDARSSSTFGSNGAIKRSVVDAFAIVKEEDENRSQGMRLRSASRKRTKYMAEDEDI